MVKQTVFFIAALVLVNDNLLLARNEHDKGIRVSGIGRTVAKPNMASTSIGVEAVGSTLQQAKIKSNNAMETIIDKIKSLGVADKDIQTRSYHVTTLTDSSSVSKAPKVTGYRINNQVNVKIRNLADVGPLLDAVVALGANDISGISFEIDDPTHYQGQARQLAVKDACEKAGQLARASGIVLGKVLSISESGASGRSNGYRAFSMSEMANAAVPVQTGEMEIVVQVDMLFDIQDYDHC